MSSPLAQPGPPAGSSPLAQPGPPARLSPPAGKSPAATGSPRVASDRLSLQHQREVGAVAGSVSGVVGNIAFGANPADISTWYLGVAQGLIQRIMTGYAAARNSSLNYLTRHAALNRSAVDVVPGSLDATALARRLEIVGPIGFKSAIAAGQSEAEALRHMATNMQGVADEAVRNGDRDVIVRTAQYGHGVVGWRRRLSGHGCGFCSMLASRGAVYVSRQTAVLAYGAHAYHPHCHCWAEPLYERDRGKPEPPEVQRLQRQWARVTAGTSGKEAQRAWRQHWEERATPEARAAHGITIPERERVFRGFDEAPTPAPTGAAAAAEGTVTHVEDLPRLENPEDRLAVARGTNPRYAMAYEGPFTPDMAGTGVGYTQNCTRVAITYEMRRRGFAVTAGAGQTIGDTSAAYIRTFRLDGHYATRIAEDLSHKMTAREVAAEVESWPRGGRGIIVVQGHTLNVERDLRTGRAVFVDAQSARLKNPVMTVDGFEKRLRERGAPTDWVGVARVDDLELSDYGLRYVESPELSLADGHVGRTEWPTPDPGRMASFEEIARLTPDDTYGAALPAKKAAPAKKATAPPAKKAPAAPKPPTLAALRKQVTDAGITIPTGAPRAVVENLVDALERGVAPARAREAAVRELTELRGMVGDKLAQTAAALENGASDRAMAYYARQLRRLSSGEGGVGFPARAVPELGKPLQDLIAALERGDAAAAKAALPKAVTGSKLKALGEPGAVVARSKLGSDLEWVGSGRGDVVEVLHPGYSTTLEGKTLTVTKPSVRAATPEQAQAFRVAQPVKRAPAKATAPATGEAALRAAPVRAGGTGGTQGELVFRGRRPAGLSEEDARAGFQALSQYRQPASLSPTPYTEVNARLRNIPPKNILETSQAEAERLAARIDKVMDVSPLSREVVVWRTTPAGEAVFGDRLAGDLAGFTWREGAYLSTSASAEAGFYGGVENAVRMRIVVPKEVHGIQMSDFRVGTQLDEAELLLERGLTLRVVADRGIVDGKRLLDVEVVPKSAPTQAAAKAAPAKKAATPRVPKAPEPAKMSLPALRTELDKVMERAGTAVDLATVPKPALADMVTRARTLPAAELKAEVGRWRQVVIDRRRDVADLLSQADQLLDAEATAAVLGQRGASIVRRWEQAAAGWPDLAEARKVVAAMQTGDAAKVRRAIAAARKKLGLEQIGADAGTVARYDAKAMTPIGGKIPADAHVVVVRPGYRMADGTVLSKPVVEEATAQEVSAATKTTAKKAAPVAPTSDRLSALRQDEAAGRMPEVVPFYGNASPFSQHYAARFEIDGVSYSSTEQYMMAEKARMFGDDDALRRIMATDSPVEAKRIGREVRNFDAPRWDAASYDIVIRANLAKFGQNPELRRQLLGTGDAVLAEASPRDTIWGIGRGAANAGSPSEWRGQNRLGFALMDVRDQLRTTQAAGRVVSDWTKVVPDAAAFRAMSSADKLQTLRQLAEDASARGHINLTGTGQRTWAKHVLTELPTDELRRLVDELADISNWGTSEKHDKGLLAQVVINLTGLNPEGRVETATGPTSFAARQAAKAAGKPVKRTRRKAQP